MPATLTVQAGIYHYKDLCYSIEPGKIGYIVKVWEPAIVTQDRLKPFLWMVKRSVLTEEEGRKVAIEICENVKRG